MRDAHRYAGPTNAQRSTIKMGDVVIIHDESLPRGFWKLARVEKVVCGRDVRIRAATVRLSSGQGILHRPVQLIYPLEVHDDSDVETTGKESCDQETVVTTPTEPQLTIHDHMDAVTRVTLRRTCQVEANLPLNDHREPQHWRLEIVSKHFLLMMIHVDHFMAKGGGC